MEITTFNKSKLENPITVKEYMHKYYDENKTKILTNLKSKINCPLCDKKTSKVHLKRHQNTEYCRKYRIIE